MTYSFASRLVELRSQARITQRQLAAMLGVDKQTVSNWECGRNVPASRRHAAILAVVADTHEAKPAVEPARLVERI